MRNGILSSLLPVVLYCAFIFVLSSMNAPPTPTFDLEWGDKVVHAGAYALMMFAAFRAARWLLPERGTRTQLAIALLYTVLFGVSDEFHQSLVPSRHFDPYDMVADAVGGLLATFVAAALLPTRLGAMLFNTRTNRT